MKTMFVLLLIVAALTVSAQTNSAEYRMIGSVKYDASKPPFITVTIPAGAALANERFLNYKGPASPAVNLELQTPAVYNFNRPIKMTVAGFPYSPAYFRQGYWQTGYTTQLKFGNANQVEKGPKIENGLVTKSPMTLRLFPLSHPRTNYTATGPMTI